MYYYHLYGCRVQSERELFPLVQESSVDRPDIVLCPGAIPEEVRKQIENGKTYGMGANLSWLDNRVCTICVTDGKKIIYRLKPEEKESYLQSYLLGFGMSMLFLQRGDMAIHGSALHNGAEAILIAGESGSGKSTLTNSYLAKGWELMADDMVIAKFDKVAGTLLYPAFPYQKLCRNVALERGYDLSELLYINERKDKFLVPYQGSFELTAKPLKKFLMLGVHRGEEFFSQEVTGIDKLTVCVNNLFLRHLLGDRKYAPEIGQKCLELIASVDMYLLARPEGKDTTKLLRETAFGIVV